MADNYIEFSRKRDFGQKINVSFEFVQKNFKPLGKALVMISGPMAVLAAIAYILYMDDISNMMSGLSSGSTDIENPFASFNFIWSLLAFIVSIMLAYVLITATTLEYVNIYREKKSSDISVQEVWDRVKSSFGKIFVSMILLFFGYMLVLSVVVLFVVAMSDSVGLIVLFMFVFFCVFIYLVISISVYYNILLHENRSAAEFGSIIKRCFFLVRGKWWSTFGVVFIMGLIVALMGGILQLPLTVFQFKDIFSNLENEEQMMTAIYEQNVFEMVYSGVVVWAQALLNSVSVLAVTFQYFNLRERKESTGLLEEIQSIQTGPESKETTGDSEEDEDY